MVQDYTIADIAHVDGVLNLNGFYDATKLVEIENFSRVQAWFEPTPASPTPPAVRAENSCAPDSIAARLRRPQIA